MSEEENTRISKWIDRYCWIIAFMLILVMSFLYAERRDVTEYYYDSKDYWNLANAIFENEGKAFSPLFILRYPKSFRGYFFPVLVGFFKYIFQGTLGWQVLSSLSMAACFSLVLPFAIKGKSICSWHELSGTLAAYAIFMWIWGDLMQYPLSDFMSCFLFLSAIAFLRSISRNRKTIVKILFGFAAGALLYAAYNTRSTFLYAGIIVTVAFILIHRREPSTLSVALVMMIAGVTVTALPQCYINRNHEGAFSPKVYYDLIDSEVYRGIYTSRYETYIGSPEQYSSVRVIFDDLAGLEIILRENMKEEDFKLSEIFRLFRKYPLDLIGIYTRHLLSLLTPTYRQIYVRDIYAVDWLCIIVSILLWLTTAFDLFSRIRRDRLSLNALWIIAVCVPGLLQVFDEPELRFFLPIYVLCYYYVFAVINWRDLVRALKVNLVQVLVIGLVFFVLWISLAGNTIATARDKKLLLSDNSIHLVSGEE